MGAGVYRNHCRHSLWQRKCLSSETARLPEIGLIAGLVVGSLFVLAGYASLAYSGDIVHHRR